MAFRMGDIIVVLPGIIGSVLEKDGQEIWAISRRAISSYLRTFGRSPQALEVTGVDDPALDKLGDGVVATKLMPDTHIVPGLWKIDGYGELTKTIRASFEVEEGKNYFEFPYDWRRDNRASARRLDELIKVALPAWREHSGNSGAKVILLAHSMGGLISRYYAEVMEGWKNCRALITLGTPYRGSVKALNYLFNGYRVGPTDLSAVFRSCTSVYQLLPTYPVCSSPGKVLHVGELPESRCLSLARCAEARAFHQAIEDAVARNAASEEYRLGYRLLPVIGTDQPTLNSVRVDGHDLDASEQLPEGVDPLMAYGDGTVPLVSGVPLEWSREFRMPFYAEVHGSIQNNPLVRDAVREWLRQTQVERLENLRAVTDQKPLTEPIRPALRLRLNDAYGVDEPVVVRVEVGGSARQPDKVTVVIYPLDEGREPIRRDLSESGGEWSAEIADLKEGCYRIRARCQGEELEVVPPPVSDVFAVVGKD